MEARHFSRIDSQKTPSTYLKRLMELYGSLDIEQDPAVMRLKALGVDENHYSMRKALQKRSTLCQKTMKAITATAQSVFTELGAWACDYYISCCASKIQRLKVEHLQYEDHEHNEKRYLQNLFASATWAAPSTDFVMDDPRLSSKTRCLLKVLTDELNGTTGIAGLIFTQTRASVAVLAHLLSSQAHLATSLQIGTFVGNSGSTVKKSLAEINNVENQTETLNDLRLGKKNLIIATSVLEEGIDISACNVVICFEAPQNLKSFIQRRGRARQSHSKYIILFPSELSQSINERVWRTLEEEMKSKYMDDMRELDQLRLVEESEEGEREFVVPRTG